MRRITEPPSPEEGVRQFLLMLREGRGLSDLRSLLPEGATMRDALIARRRQAQVQRQPCSFLDDELGIER